MELRVVNIVAMAPVEGVPFDALRSTLAAHGVLNSGRSVWLATKWPPDQFYAAFYKSGKVQTPGAKTMAEVQRRLATIQGSLESWGLPVRIGKPTVQNLVVMGKIDLRRSLDFLARSSLSYSLSYEPEQFPALHVSTDGATFLLYQSGSFVLTGIRDISTAHAKTEELVLQLQSVGAA